MSDHSSVDPPEFTEFGALLRYLRRRARLTQRDLGIAVGYSEGHINRFEKNKNVPDPVAVAALFVPALDLTHEPELSARLIDLATSPHRALPKRPKQSSVDLAAITLESIPPPAPHEITRADTLERLRARLASERRVVLCGMAGIGKTTLASAIARDAERAHTMPVFWLTLTEGLTTSADTLIHQLAAFLLAQGYTQVEPLLAIDDYIKPSLPFDQKIALIGSLLNKQPMLLCFDNVELIQRDAAWLHALKHLLSTTSAFFLFTSREIFPLAGLSEMTVYGFECAEGLSFIAQIGQTILDEHQAERLIDKTDGSPMLLQLAISHLLDQRGDVESSIQHLEMQPQIAFFLLQTVERQLPTNAWRLALLLAVFQQPMDLCDQPLGALAHALADIDNIGQAVAELQRRHLIGDAMRAQLHPLVRDYVYRSLNDDPHTSQRLHRLAADWFIDQDQDVIAGAYHYARAGLIDAALRTIEENETAILNRGQSLAAVAILDELRAQIQRLRSDQNEFLRRLLTLRGIMLTITLRNAEGETNLRQAIALATHPAVRAQIVYRLAELMMLRSDFRAALTLVQTARTDLAPTDVLLHARLVSLECNSLAALGQVEEGERAAHQVLAFADQLIALPLVLTGEVRARAQIELANIARMRRDLKQSMHCAQAALASARSGGSLRRMTSSCLGFIGGLYYDEGDLDAALRYRSQALEGYQAVGDIHSAAYVLTYLADIHHTRLEEEQALEKSEQAAETLRLVQDMRGLAAAASARVSSLLWCGRVDEARRAIERLLIEAEGKGTERLWGYRLNKLAMVQFVQAEIEAAIATLRRALELPTTLAHPMMQFELRSTLALALVVAGDVESAMEDLDDSPHIDGLSRWAEFDRALIEGYVELARENRSAADSIADQIAQRAQKYPLYRQCARQLKDAFQRDLPREMFPRSLWVNSNP